MSVPSQTKRIANQEKQKENEAVNKTTYIKTKYV